MRNTMPKEIWRYADTNNVGATGTGIEQYMGTIKTKRESAFNSTGTEDWMKCQNSYVENDTFLIPKAK